MPGVALIPLVGPRHKAIWTWFACRYPCDRLIVAVAVIRKSRGFATENGPGDAPGGCAAPRQKAGRLRGLDLDNLTVAAQPAGATIMSGLLTAPISDYEMQLAGMNQAMAPGAYGFVPASPRPSRQPPPGTPNRGMAATLRFVPARSQPTQPHFAR